MGLQPKFILFYLKAVADKEIDDVLLLVVALLPRFILSRFTLCNPSGALVDKVINVVLLAGLK